MGDYRGSQFVGREHCDSAGVPCITTSIGGDGAPVPYMHQPLSCLPSRNTPTTSTSPNEIPSFDAKSVDDVFQFNNLVKSVTGPDPVNLDSSASSLPRQDSDLPRTNWLSAQKSVHSDNRVVQITNVQDPSAVKSFPWLGINAKGGSSTVGCTWESALQYTQNHTFGNHNQTSGALHLQNTLTAPSAKSIQVNSNRVLQMQKSSEELDGESLTLGIGGNAELNSAPTASTSQIPQRTDGCFHHQAITSQGGSKNLLVPEPNSGGVFLSLEENKCMKTDALTVHGVHDIRPTAFNLLQPMNVSPRSDYLMTNNRTFGLVEGGHVKHGVVDTSRSLPVQGHEPQEKPLVRNEAGQFAWIQSQPLSSPLVCGTTPHASPGAQMDTTQTNWNLANPSSMMTSPEGLSGTVLSPQHSHLGELSQPRFHHLVQASEDLLNHGSAVESSPAVGRSEPSESSNVLARSFRKRVAQEQPPENPEVNRRRTRTYHPSNIQTIPSHKSCASPSPSHFDQTAPALTRQGPCVKYFRSQYPNALPAPDSSAAHQHQSCSSQSLSYFDQTAPAFPRQGPRVKNFHSQYPNALPAPDSSAAHQRIPFRPPVLQTSNSLSAHAPEYIPLSHRARTNLSKQPIRQVIQSSQHSRQTAPLNSVPLSASPEAVQTQDSPFQRIKWQGLVEEQRLAGHKCCLCKRDLSYPAEGPIDETPMLPVSSVLPCGHTFHDFCLQRITPPDQAENPPCIPCVTGED